MSFTSGSIRPILVIDAFLYLFGLIGIYLLSLKSDLPFILDYSDTGITVKESLIDSNLKLTGNKIIAIDNINFSFREETELYLDRFNVGDAVNLTFADQTQFEIRLINYYSIPYLILAFLVGTSFFVIAIAVLIKARLQKPARLFHWVCVFTALIIMATWGYYGLKILFFPFLVKIVLHLSVSIVPALFIHFTSSFPREKRIFNKYSIYFLYILSALIFLLLNIIFYSLVNQNSLEGIKAYVFGYNISRIYLIVCVIAALIVFIHSYITSPTQSDKKKLKWILYGLTVGPLGYILLWTLPIIVTDKSFLPEELILVLVSIIPITFGISIAKYHVMDIDYIINRSFVYSVVIMLLLLIYLGLIALLANLTVLIEPKIASVISALSVAILAQPIRTKAQKIIDKKFFRQQYDFRQAIKKIFEQIQEANSITLISDKFISGINELIPVERIGFLMFIPSTNTLKLIANYNFEPLTEHSVIFQKNKLKNDLSLPVASIESVESGVVVEHADYEVFKQWGIKLALALKSADKEIIGFLVMGNKKAGTKFSNEDIDLLTTISNRVASSIDKIRIQEELIIERIESERLDELNRMKSYFVSSVSHDMKTPLTSIKMFAELLQNSSDANSEKSKEYLNIIDGETSRLTRLIDSVLDFSKIERGIKHYNFKLIRLNEIVATTIKMMHYQLEMNKFKVEVNLTEVEKMISADDDSVEEALVNLLSNSIKYSSDKKVIRVSTLFKNNYMILSVEDEGVGISKENIDNIFNPFFRIDSIKFHKSGGAGLGLSIVKHIIDEHKGKIEVQSEPGKGSKFELFFPVVT